MTLHRTAIFLAAMACSAGAAADASTLYRCSDESGVILYTNQKAAKKNCTVLSVQTPPPSRSGNDAAAPRASRTATPTPSDFPRVSGDQQKERDNDRRAILQRELAAEQGHLDKARQALGSSPTQAAKDSVVLHERNIEALNKELAKLK